MTKADKAELRRELKARPERTDAEIARLLCCHVSTVKRYRAVLCATTPADGGA